LKHVQNSSRRLRFREGKTLSRFIARDVRRDILIVSAARIDEGIITGRVRTTNVLYSSRGLTPQPEFEPARELHIDEMWHWKGKSWGGLPDGTSIADNAPGGQSVVHMTDTKKRSGCWYAFLGAAAGGCLFPLILLLIAAALGDTGGPLFWPIISIPLALIGLALGLWFHSEFRKKE
jgi:hypothetical protein